MRPEPRAGWRGRAGLILLAVAAAAIWWLLDRSEPRADWLHVEAPRRAVAGQPLPLRVRLAPQAEPTRVCVDLHWAATHNETVGCLASGGSKAVGTEGGTFDFEIPVRPVEGLRFVAGIIYLTRTGNWEDHTLAASTALIPVSTDPNGGAETRLEPVRLQPPADRAGGHPRPPTFLRWLTALALLAAAATAWNANLTTERSAPGGGTRRGQRLAVLLALAGLYELSGLDSWLGAHARAMASTGDFYYLRAAFQKAAISLTGAAMIGLLVFLRRARRAHRLLLAAFGLYLGIAAANLVSLHALDRVANLSWQGVPLVEALAFTCAALTWYGVRLARRADARLSPSEAGRTACPPTPGE